MDVTIKNNIDLVASWIEHASQVRTREFRKYWEHKHSPQNYIENLISADPSRAAEIIVQIAEEIETNGDLQTKLICGLIYDFEHFTDDKQFELLRLKLKNTSIYKYLTSNKA